MDFVKMHGLGNDFIFIEDKEGAEKDYTELAARLCDRHTGIGADGLIVTVPSDKADVCMRIINADGSEAEMCGNGIRCFAKFVYEQGIISAEEFTVETLGGIMKPTLHVENGKVKTVTIDMGMPRLDRKDIPMEGPAGEVKKEPFTIDGQTYLISSMYLGVPHTMVFVDDVTKIDLPVLGRKIETHPAFPNRTNVNFVQQIDEHTIKVRTWERGAGATLACGTGSCASAVAAFLSGMTGREVDVELYLGTLRIEYRESDGRVYMTGPAEVVFTGTI